MGSLGTMLVTLGALGAATVGCNDPEVRFGDVGGLRDRGGGVNTGAACTYPPGTDEMAAGAACPTWDLVYEIFEKPEVGCTLASCHNTGAIPPIMPQGGADEAYGNLAAYVLKERPYIEADGQDRAALLCNIWIDAPAQLGSPMPRLGLIATVQNISDDDLATIGTWAACGMQLEGGGVGGGGMGGDLGIGGAGGAGGGL